jgi:hypothetical protein
VIRMVTQLIGVIRNMAIQMFDQILVWIWWNSDGGDTSLTANGNTEMVAASSSASISQEKYDQLVTLLQQANLIPSASSNLGSSSNHIHTTPTAEPGLKPHYSHLSSIHSIVSCSIQSNSQFWLIDSGANDHICSSLDWFSSYYKIKGK